MAATAASVPEELLSPVVSYFQPRRVILFGSHARGDAGPDSDFDLLVVVDDDTPPERFSWQARYEARRSFHRAVDILLCRESVFADKARLPATLAHTVANEGLVVYERQ
jgi:predicted nucleotidyltransferase